MDTAQLISKRDARMLGLKRYFTGVVCRNGHLAERFVCDGGCVVCRHNNGRSARELEKIKNPRPERIPMTPSQYTMRWRERHPEKHSAYRKKIQESGKNKEYSRRYYERHPEMRGKWAKDNPALAAARARRYAAKRVRATVPWADMARIDQIYEEARRISKETGVPHEVDHIYPLQGKTVSGLHHELNLRIIPRQESRTKGNRLPVGV